MTGDPHHPAARDEAILAAYEAGELSPEEAEAFEARLAAGARDDDRLEAYLAGALDDDEAEAFELRLFEDPTIAQRHELAMRLRVPPGPAAGAPAVPPGGDKQPSPGPGTASAADGARVPGSDVGERSAGPSGPSPLALAACLLLALSLGSNAVLYGNLRDGVVPGLRPAEVITLTTLRGGDARDAYVSRAEEGPLVLRLDPGPVPGDRALDVRLIGAQGRSFELPGARVGEDYWVDVVVDRATLAPGPWTVELRYDDGEVVRYEMEVR